MIRASLRAIVCALTVGACACGGSGSSVDDAGQGVDASDASDAAVPSISGFDPATPFTGREVVIEGTRFGSDIAQTRVFFDESPVGGAVPTAVVEGAVTLTIPTDLPGLGAGVNKVFEIRVHVADRVSAPVLLTVRPPLEL